MVTKEPFEVYVCSSCGLGVTLPQPKDVGKYYRSEEYLSHQERRDNWFQRIYHWVQHYTFWKRRRLLERFVSGRHILDYGCGRGAFGTYLTQQGWHVVGVELDENARKQAQKNFPTFHPEEKTYLQKAYDVILLWHVLEHLYTPLETLRQLCSCLKPSGVLVIAVPHYDSPHARYFNTFWAGWDVPRHLFHFSKTFMKKQLPEYLKLRCRAYYPLYIDGFYTTILSERYQKGANFWNLPLGALKGAFLALQGCDAQCYVYAS